MNFDGDPKKFPHHIRSKPARRNLGRLNWGTELHDRFMLPQFVSHPGERNYETFPVNANEAEARRVARFWQHGHTQGVMTSDLGEPHAAHPYTLDMRHKAR